MKLAENSGSEMHDLTACKHVTDIFSDADSIRMGHSVSDTDFDINVNKPHLHRHYELFYNVSGAEAYMVNSKFYKCGSHDLIIIPKWQIHRVIAKKKGVYDRCVINMDDYIVNLLEILCCSENMLSWLKGNYKNIPQKITLSSNQHEIFIPLIDEYAQLLKNGRNIEAMSVFMKLLSYLDDWFCDIHNSEQLDDDYMSYTDRVIRIVEENFKTVTVSEIASQISVNSDYLNRMFKDEWGITISTYLIMRRIAEAKKHLCTGKTAKEACYLSGFRDYSNFLRTFKNYEGYSPNSISDYET